MRLLILLLVGLLATPASAQKTPKDILTPKITVSHWVRDGNLKRWEAFVEDGKHMSPIVVSENKDGDVDFHVERKCYEKDKAVPRTILAWRGGREIGLELRCDGAEVVSTKPRAVEDAAMRAPGFPPELREKIQKERTLLGEKKSPAPQKQEKKPKVPSPEYEELVPLELRAGHRRI